MSFQTMAPERLQEIARKGGQSLQPQQRSFSQNRELARLAGRKGGLTPKKAKPTLTSEQINTLATEITAKVPRGSVATCQTDPSS